MLPVLRSPQLFRRSDIRSPVLLQVSLLIFTSKRPSSSSSSSSSPFPFSVPQHSTTNNPLPSPLLLLLLPLRPLILSLLVSAFVQLCWWTRFPVGPIFPFGHFSFSPQQLRCPCDLFLHTVPSILAQIAISVTVSQVSTLPAFR
ncbi:uncharacterized protein BO95DRAFT_230635 [Aspergillus brunneoviolaceus CBS 621.78]|uniref:Uncharacterized protein n=1 Tax=Aspergillus brunneoviolaceus CBS 621.78 TaxID=1450534 RepID=A0ACD1G0H9_9EURO|nr:hypothetical protein BO95DRAFT_230635 [Aspergillus brunneoviolaceus CBS 621.78]RAH42709.1 hypothetical protein BO95DRAFT_230635 [Aspergillus brunneoviolaceus CBS 621.78]